VLREVPICARNLLQARIFGGFFSMRRHITGRKESLRPPDEAIIEGGQGVARDVTKE
jgi:hypothetical protein